LMLSVGISLWLGPVNVRFRDIQIIIPLLLQILFILTPVMYPAPESLQPTQQSLTAFLYNLNPMTGIIDGFRYCLIGEGTPLATPFLCSYVLVFVLFLSGFAFFNFSQNKFADII
ncbi:MAG: ABC transporter permease, partial [Planctomycetes bacterium]|nr:ABC transporter permease [Planctomycetota bacterium]